jgi:hypothetical protein
VVFFVQFSTCNVSRKNSICPTDILTTKQKSKKVDIYNSQYHFIMHAHRVVSLSRMHLNRNYTQRLRPRRRAGNTIYTYAWRQNTSSPQFHSEKMRSPTGTNRLTWKWINQDAERSTCWHTARRHIHIHYTFERGLCIRRVRAGLKSQLLELAAGRERARRLLTLSGHS